VSAHHGKVSSEGCMVIANTMDQNTN